MTVTYTNLVGDYENSDKVIAYNLEQQWNAVNTGSVTPVFENGLDEPDYNAQFDRSGPNKVLVNFINNEYTGDVNSDTIHVSRETVLVTIVAESRDMRIMLENEVNRILWELAPNSGTRLTKSDLSDSHIARFENSEISFGRIQLPDDQTMWSEGSEGELYCISYKFKT